MNKLFQTTILAMLMLLTGSAKAQTAEMIIPDQHSLIPGQVVAYLQYDATLEQAQNLVADLDLEILDTDIQPVSTILRNPGQEAVKQLKNHPAIQGYELDTIVYDSASLKKLKFGGTMTQQQKEEARQRFLQREDLTLMLVRFRYEVTQPKAETILSAIEGIDEFNLRAAPRMVYVKVEKGTEPEHMEKLQQQPLITKVARTAETVATNDF